MKVKTSVESLNENAMVRVEFEVLVTKNGNVMKNTNPYDWSSSGCFYGGHHIETRECEAETAEDAFVKACEMGGNPNRTMWYHND